jgi:hypothetical protein
MHKKNAHAINRREFLKGSAALGASVLAAPAFGRALGANDRITIGFIGCGGMGIHHIRRYRELLTSNASGLAISPIITRRWDTRPWSFSASPTARGGKRK